METVMKTVILHYHLFKNAGTSLDAAFKQNFSEKNGEWVTKEFPAKPELNRIAVKDWIVNNPEAICFSSHTAILPPPTIDGLAIVPVIFMRHPIDRIASAYAFEKKQGGDSFGAVLARNTNLAGYMEARLSLGGDRQCRNFHAERFAAMLGEKRGDENFRANMAMDELPFVGLVEEFSKSLKILEKVLLSNGLSDVNLTPMEKNVSRAVKQSLEQKLQEIKDKIGGELYANLVKANRLDIQLYEKLVGTCYERN